MGVGRKDPEQRREYARAWYAKHASGRANGERGTKAWAVNRKAVLRVLRERGHLHLHRMAANGKGNVRWMLVLDTDVREYAHRICEEQPDRCIHIKLGGNNGT